MKLGISIPCLMGYRPGYRFSRLLTQFYGRGLDEENCKAVKRCHGMVEARTRRCRDAAATGVRRRRAMEMTNTLKAVKEMPLVPSEFIVCTGQGLPRHGDPYSP